MVALAQPGGASSIAFHHGLADSDQNRIFIYIRLGHTGKDSWGGFLLQSVRAQALKIFGDVELDLKCQFLWQTDMGSHTVSWVTKVIVVL